MEYIRLNNGVEMPLVGLGTFMLTPDEALKQFALWKPDVEGQK